jgi:hypothetical protein
MSDPPAHAKQQAMAARRARQRMIHRLRSRVAALTVGIFLVAFAGLFIELAGGHELGLNTTAATASQPLARDGSSDGGTTFGADDQLTNSGSQSDDQATSATDGGSSSAGAASAVVTRQS